MCPSHRYNSIAMHPCQVYNPECIYVSMHAFKHECYALPKERKVERKEKQKSFPCKDTQGVGQWRFRARVPAPRPPSCSCPIFPFWPSGKFGLGAADWASLCHSERPTERLAVRGIRASRVGMLSQGSRRLVGIRGTEVRRDEKSPRWKKRSAQRRKSSGSASQPSPGYAL